MRTSEQLADTVTKLRKEKGLTITDVAKKIGVGKSTISRYERHENKIPMTQVGLYAEALNVDIMTLMLTEEEKLEWENDHAINIDDVFLNKKPLFYKGKKVDEKIIDLIKSILVNADSLSEKQVEVIKSIADMNS